LALPAGECRAVVVQNQLEGAVRHHGKITSLQG
jgi:hypothetical protein